MIFIAIAHLCVYKRLSDEKLLVSALELKSKLSRDDALTPGQWCDQNRAALSALKQSGLIAENKLIETFYRHTGEEWGYELTETASKLIAQHKGDDDLHDATVSHLWPRTIGANTDWNALAGGMKGWTLWRG